MQLTQQQIHPQRSSPSPQLKKRDKDELAYTSQAHIFEPGGK